MSSSNNNSSSSSSSDVERDSAVNAMRRKNTSTIEDAVLQFEDIKFVAGKGKQEKVVVQQVGATVQHGHVLAIMGPSGAGKTTLINVLTQNAFYGQAHGSVTLNGTPMSDSIFKQYCYLVKQYDANWPYLTCRETLLYAAELYDICHYDDNGTSTTASLVNDLLHKTGLNSCADTKCARLSGGQQRRLSLAVALLKQPSVLFLDEPTSGLDAASASAVMRELTRVAKEERLIMICTIHQPSTKVYNGFDDVMILSKGRLAYVGKAETASDYFDSIGYELPAKTNPAEHFLDVVNADFSSGEEVDRLLDTWSLSSTNKQRRKTQAISEESSSSGTMGNTTKMNHRLYHEVPVMLKRHLKLIIRDPVTYLGRIVGFLIVNCIFGVVYIAARSYTQDQVVNKVWISAWFLGVPSNMAVVAVYQLNSELKSIFVENKNGMGSAMSYMIAKTLLVVPLFFVFALAALGIPGYLIQDFPSSSFLKMILLYTVQIAMWESSAEAFAAMFDEAVLGMLVHTAWWFGALLFSGFLVPLEDLFWPLKTFYYILPYSYYIRSAMYLIFAQSTWEPCVNPDTFGPVCIDSTNGLEILREFERSFPLVSSEDSYWTDLLVLLGLGLFWKVTAVVIILFKSSRTSSIIEEQGRSKRTRDVASGYAAGQAVVESDEDVVAPEAYASSGHEKVAQATAKPSVSYEEALFAKNVDDNAAYEC